MNKSSNLFSTSLFHFSLISLKTQQSCFARKVRLAIDSRILLLLQGIVSQDFLISVQNSANYLCGTLSQPVKSKPNLQHA